MYVSRKKSASPVVNVSVYGRLRGKYRRGSGSRSFTVRDATVEEVARIVTRALKRAAARN